MAKQRRRPGNIRIEDRHYTDAKRKLRTSRWRTDDAGKLVPVGLRWMVRWVDHTETERTKSFRLKLDAEAFRDKVIAGMRDGTYVDAKRADITVSELGAVWLKTIRANLAPSTVSSCSNLMNGHVLPRFGGRVAGTITRAEVADWLADLTDAGLGSATVSKCLYCFRQSIALGIPDHLRADPSAGLSGPKLPPPKDRFLSVAELYRLAAWADYRRANIDGDPRASVAPVDLDAVPEVDRSPDGLLVLVLGITGLRIGEAVALLVSDFDADAGTLTVSRATAEVAGELIDGATKTRAGRRRVHLPDRLRDELRAYATGLPADRRLFVTPSGAAIARSNWNRRVLQPAAELAGLMPLTAHDLRHTAASIAASAGVRPEVVSAQLGHADPAFSLRRYVGLFDQDLSASADLVNQALKQG